MKFKNIKLAIIDDHRMFLDSLKLFLELQNFISKVDVFMSIDSFLLSKRKYDIVLLDLDLDGVSGFELFQNKFSDNVLILTSHKEISKVNLAYKLGAKGYILKNATMEETLEAIKLVANGKSYFSKNVIVDNKMSKELTLESLSEKQKEILKQLSDGKSYEEISENLFISPATVKVHKYNILKKLNLEKDVDLSLKFSGYFDSKTN